MRTAILVGLIYVGDRIRIFDYSDIAEIFLATLILTCIAMDIMEFLHNLEKK